MKVSAAAHVNVGEQLQPSAGDLLTHLDAAKDLAARGPTFYLLHLLPAPHLPAPAHSESKWQVPSGAFEHLPLLHFAPPPPQSESKLHELPAAVEHLPLLHFTLPPQSESK
jgi:hypothetical protein